MTEKPSQAELRKRILRMRRGPLKATYNDIAIVLSAAGIKLSRQRCHQIADPKYKQKRKRWAK